MPLAHLFLVVAVYNKLAATAANTPTATPTVPAPACELLEELFVAEEELELAAPLEEVTGADVVVIVRSFEVDIILEVEELV